MKRLLTSVGIAMLALSAMAADIPLPSGYYRVQNKWSERYITLIDNRGSINYGAMTADLGAIVTLPSFDAIVDNPGTIIYLNKTASDKYDLQSQGTSTKKVVDHVLQLAQTGDGAYLAYASQNGITMYLSDSGPKDEPFGVIATNNSSTTNKRLHWIAWPLDAKSSDSYFGLKPKKMGNAYYTSFFACFPFEMAEGMTAYYVSQVDEAKGMAVIKEISGHVPGATPVIVKSTKEGAANNKLNLLPPSDESINGNKLTGVYFMNDGLTSNPKHQNVVAYDASTMRVLGTAADGSAAFIKATNLKYVPANSVYLKVSASAPSVIKMVTEEEYKSVQDVTVTAKNVTCKYGDAIPKFEYEASASLTGEPSLTCNATSTSPVGTYVITVGQGSVSGATVKGVNGTLTITPAELTVKPNDATRVEGQDNPAFTLSYAGFKNSETEAVLTEKPVATTTATKESAPGTYDITVSGGKATNYTFKYETGKLTVTEAKLVIKAKDTLRVYGDANPVFEYVVVEGTIKGGEPKLSCAADAKSAVGEYAIKVEKGTLANNNVEFVDGKMTVKPATLTVTVENANRLEGEENPDFKLKYEGFKNSETDTVLTEKPTATTTATKESAIGTYEIIVSGGAAQNYTLTYVNGTLTVTEKPEEPVTVTAKSYTRKYGDPNPEFEYETAGAELKGKPVLSCDADEKSPVGTYPIKVATGTIENCALTLVDGVLTIVPDTLIVIVKDDTRCTDEENPEFELEYFGFKNGETDTVFTEKPIITCEAQKDCEEGEYPIVVSGGKATNYYLKYVNGTLTVSGNSAVNAVLLNESRKTPAYTLSGQKVNVGNLRKGVYVIGGRKVIVK